MAEHDWKNFTETLYIEDGVKIQVFDMNTEDELVDVIKYANRNHLKIRASAGWNDGSEDESTKSCFNSCCGNKEAVEERYNESFSWTPFVPEGTDIIVRFSPKFHKVTIHPETETVTVTAGTQIGTLVNELWDAGYSLSTASMIPYVSAVGLAATGGHGTGIRQPSFAGLVQKLRICDHLGNIIDVDSSHPNFETIRGAHLGLFGVVISVDLQIVKRFWLKETRIPLNDASNFRNLLHDYVQHHDYTTLISIPTYPTGIVKNICNWEIRVWDKVDPSIENNYVKPPSTAMDFFQHIKVQTGQEVIDMLGSDNPTLIRTFMNIAAMVEIGTKVTEYTTEERFISHSQISFPKHMVDLSILFPLKWDNFQNLVSTLEWLEDKLRRYNKDDKFPVTLAIYVRFFKGTNGGFSTSACRDDEFIVALEMATGYPNPYWESFRDTVMEYLADKEPRMKYHLGKYIPRTEDGLKSFYDDETWNECYQTIIDWYGSEDNFKRSPFTTSYIRGLIYGFDKPESQNKIKTSRSVNTNIVTLPSKSFVKKMQREAKKYIH